MAFFILPHPPSGYPPIPQGIGRLCRENDLLHGNAPERPNERLTATRGVKNLVD